MTSNHHVSDVTGAADVTDAVDHPKHYGGADDPYEAIKVIEAWGVGFHVGIALKHLARAGKKPNEPEDKDIEKAVWYLRRYLEVLKGPGA